MRLLFYIHSLSSGGAERVTTTLANYWAENGWHVIVVTVTGRQGDFYSLDDRIERIALGMDSSSASALQAVVNNGRRVRALRRILRDIKPDVAVAMMATANATLALAGWGLPIATIGSERIHPPKLPLGRAWETVRRWSYPRLTGLVAQTEQSANWLRAHAPARHITVIPNPLHYPLACHGAGLAPNAILEETGCPQLLLSVGRLENQKGFDYLLQAFSEVIEAHPNWTLVILGEGSLRPVLEDHVNSLGIEDRVRLPGAVGNVAEWYEAADIYVLTSRFEGFPNTLLEALAHGVPAIAVDCETGPKEILRHEVDGLLVPNGDVADLAKSLDQLMGDENLRRVFGTNAIGVRDRFSMEKIIGMWEALFEDLMNGK
jgi:glycosyltransferase involved in cell wall biosynthesis